MKPSIIGAKACLTAGFTDRYSAIRVSSSAPSSDRMTVAPQPVRSLPAVQWKSSGPASGSAASVSSIRYAACAEAERTKDR